MSDPLNLKRISDVQQRHKVLTVCSHNKLIPQKKSNKGRQQSSQLWVRFVFALSELSLNSVLKSSCAGVKQAKLSKLSKRF